MSVASAVEPKRERERRTSFFRGTLRSLKSAASRKRRSATPHEPRGGQRTAECPSQNPTGHSARSETIAGSQRDVTRTGS